MIIDGTRMKATRKYAFSSMCECAFCGTYFSRRSHHQDTQHKKPVWKCRTATNKGIANCPNSKAIDEKIIENAFLEMFRLLVENFDDVLGAVLASVEETLLNDESEIKLRRIDKNLSTLELKRKKLTDMLLDDKITKEAYDEKYNEFTYKISQVKEEKRFYTSKIDTQKDVSKRMKEIRGRLMEITVLDMFDRVVFESIVNKIIIGETNADGSVDPYKLTFVLKGLDNRTIPDAKNRYLNLNRKTD